MNLNKYFLMLLSIVVVLPNVVSAMEQGQAEEKQEAERKADFSQQMPEQPAQPDALDQEIDAYRNELTGFRAKQEKEQAERKEANTKRATNKKADNKISWNKVIAEGTSIAFGAFCGFLAAKICKECGPGSKNYSELAVVPSYAAILLPFAFAKKLNSTYWLAGFSTFSSFFLTSCAYNKS